MTLQPGRTAILLCTLSATLLRGAEVNVTYKLTPREMVAARVAMAVQANPERGAKLRELFASAGCPPDALQLQEVKDAKAPNVICTIRGDTDSEIVVGAHFDHVKRGLGVIDNWGGAALLPSLLESVRSAGRRHTFVFVGFTDEERGLIGSYYYIGHLSKERLLRIVAMINFDSVGAGPTEVEKESGDPDLRKKLITVMAGLQARLTYVDVHGGLSDYYPFRMEQVPTLLFHSITQENMNLLHSKADNLAALRMDDYYDTYRIAAVYLSYLDLVLDVHPQTDHLPSLGMPGKK